MMDEVVRVMTELGPRSSRSTRRTRSTCSATGSTCAASRPPWSTKRLSLAQGRVRPGLANLIETGRALRGTDYQKILLQRAAYTSRMRALMRQVDALLVPTTPIASPTVAQMHVSGQEYVDIWFAMMRYTAPLDMAGVPTITLPGGFLADAGTPIGFQFVGADFRET